MSARKLTEGYLAKVVKRAREPGKNDPEKLDKDQMRLYSYYKPSLVAGEYVVEAVQKINSGEQTLEIKNVLASDSEVRTLEPQAFEVVVPRFSLDRDIINSYYPPDGHQDEGRILPHIVLNDPHYPWEILPGTKEKLHSQIDNDRGMVPWVALLVFDPEELHLDDIEEAKKLNLPGFKAQEDLKNQNGNGTFPMPVADYFNKLEKGARINFADKEGFEEIKDLGNSVDVIFPRKDLVMKMFSAPAAGKEETTQTSPEELRLGIEQYKYLAHVRHINTEGCPDAGVEEEGLFSIVIASRTGALLDRALQGSKGTTPQSMSQPRTQVCHLVSIEHLDTTIDVDEWSNNNSGRVGLVSLFSWVYTALPPNPVNFVTSMRHLTECQQMLRADDKITEQLQLNQDKDPKSRVLAERLKRGYTLTRWRTQTGEETAAFTRGPLVPLIVPFPSTMGTIPDCSNTAQDYQILDPQTGLMDLSYSSAWQLGKLLAISDVPFNAALMRFRSVIRNASSDKTRMLVNNMDPKKVVLNSVAHSISSIRSESRNHTVASHRIRAPAERTVIGDAKESAALPIFERAVQDNVGTSTGAGRNADGTRAIYNGFNEAIPNNSDWPVIHTWLAEKLSLGGIPPQYLIPEPSFVPPESLRFFHIDDFWLDCLLDGALSVANHLDTDDDVIRREIKKRFNDYLKTDVPEAGFKPQIPCYGFIIRSKIVKAMPDLRITVKWKEPDNRFPVCRWTKWDDQTLMCLLDRQPDELESIVLAQPQHQQRYALGSYIDAAADKREITFVLRQLYTTAPGISESGRVLEKSENDGWLDFEIRCLHVEKIAKDVNTELNKLSKSESNPLEYKDPIANSCELGLVLNDPSYYFALRAPKEVKMTSHPRTRQLFVRDLPSKALKAAFRPRATPKATTVLPAEASSLESMATPSFVTVAAPHKELLLRPTATQQRKPSVTASSKIGAAVVAPQSNFDLTVFPDYRSSPIRRAGPKEIYPETDYIPTNNIYYFDLVFGLRKKSNSKLSTSKLLKIVFDIPIATPPSSKAEPLLTPNYDGPGVRMLGNQHFIPFLENDPTKPYLHVVLVPRSANLDYALELSNKRTVDLGFRLAEANVAPVEKETYIEVEGMRKKVPMGKVIITWSEWYKTSAHPEGEAVVRTYAVLKRRIRDDEEIGDD
ncbi:hypothetical protein BDW02DRAFT_325202 [Decorospora gaudefroyi]|uniref:Uncharacterized protein n=1 Tax=Decorospora gaudefroyi TaxID=184978 RepID=A0A6A5KGC0_9PLEO|nr:hypothetical protein BDW02DRAFT_325202 [Decorospora gaudefroyi]